MGLAPVEQCPACGASLGAATLVCPHCGATLVEDDADRARRGRRRRKSPRQPRATAVKPPRRLWKTLLWIFLAVALFAGVVAGSAYAGVYVGERERQAHREAVIQQHYQAGLEALNEGRHERAAAEFEYVLKAEPDHALAKQGLSEARVRLQVKPTPTLEMAQSLAEQLLTQAEAAYEQEDWVTAARTLTQLRALDTAYAQESVEAMLFESLYEAGQHYLAEEQLEIGISYLDQAIALRPLDSDVVAQRSLAVSYLDALNYWGVDWELCIERFEAIYATAPDYRDVTDRLYRAHIEQADNFVERGEMCPAEIQYSQALRMFADSAVEQKRASAAQVCLAATPVAGNGAMPVLTPQPIAGFSVGRLAYPVYNATTGVYDLYALYAEGRIIRVATSADQPSWEWGTGRLAYRDRTAGSLRLVLPEEGVPLQLLPPGQQAWPSLSPDSQRVAYAAPDADGTWAIYIANTNSSGEPRRIARGRAPAWGRGGLLAYTSCDTEGVCGITLDNPEDDQPGGRLTASNSDQAVTWSPGGDMMAYMGNGAGNWDLFLLSPQGGVQQLTTEASDEGLPAWSPDGSSLAFISNRGGGWAIYVMNLGTREVQRVLDLGASLPGWENQRLTWSP